MSREQRLAADPETSVFVTANAGSGKTKTLVDRVARLLLRRVEPETILCVTYTKAAAAEMQRRLFEQLGDWALRSDEDLKSTLAALEGLDPRDYDEGRLSQARTLFARALETPGGLKIQTIHAFCEKLLKRFPLEAGVSPGFSVLDDAAAANVAAAAREAVARRAMAGEPILSEAYARFTVTLHFAAFEQMFAAFETRREAIAAYVDDCGGLAGLPRAIARVCGLDHLEDAGEIEQAAAEGINRAVWLQAIAVLRQGGARDAGTADKMVKVAEDAGRGLAAFPEALAVFCTKSGEPAAWLESAKLLKERPALQDALRGERDRLLDAEARAKAARIAQDTVYALAMARIYAEAYADAKAARGALDFTDLVSKTKELLTGEDAAAWVLFKLDAGLEHILVDEAQDTAPDQWKIIDALAEEFFSGAGAGSRSLDRAIFVVGDEKQSIFSFQGAAPERLIAQSAHYEARAALAERRFAQVPLVESWRSTKQVLAFVDAVFSTDDLRGALQPRPDGVVGGAIEHVSQRHKVDPDGPGTIDLWPLEREEKEDERAAWDEPLDAGARRGAWRRLAEAIADEIVALVQRGDQVFDKGSKQWRPGHYGDVLILVRKRKALFEELLRALRRKGVPAAGADRLVLSQHPVFEDFLGLARFCLFPDDDLTCAALLRSPFCDVDEDGLFALAHGRQGSLWSVLARRGAERPEWAAALTFLGWARDEARQRTPFDFYGRVLSRLDRSGRSMRQRFATRLGPEAADAIDAWQAQALAAEGRGVFDLERFADALSRLTVTVKREMDEPRGEVRVMTAHGSKGLEASIVFLPETVSAGASRGGSLLETEEGGFLWCGSGRGDCEASTAARDRRQKREEEESLRLLYVALTRARDRLVVAGRVNASAKEENLKGWWAPLNAAFGQLEGVRSVTENGREFRRYGADPLRTAERWAPPVGRAAGADLPDWAHRPPPAEAALPAYAAPSTLLEDEPGSAPSPLARSGGLGRFRRGTMIHRLLQLLPDLAPDQRADGAARLLAKEPDLTDAQRAEMAAAALGVLNDPRIAEVFAPGSRAEAAVAGGAPDLPPGMTISGRVDRMHVKADRVLVVDFKTNRPAPAEVEGVDPAYVLQMAVYAAVLKAVFPGRRIEAALVWTDGPRLMPIPENLMAAALARLGRSG